MAGGAKAVVQMTIHQAGRPRQRQMFNTYMILTKCANKIAKSEKSLSRCDAPVRLEDMCKSEKTRQIWNKTAKKVAFEWLHAAGNV